MEGGREARVCSRDNGSDGNGQGGPLTWVLTQWYGMDSSQPLESITQSSSSCPSIFPDVQTAAQTLSDSQTEVSCPARQPGHGHGMASTSPA